MTDISALPPEAALPISGTTSEDFGPVLAVSSFRTEAALLISGTRSGAIDESDDFAAKMASEMAFRTLNFSSSKTLTRLPATELSRAKIEASVKTFLGAKSAA